MTDPLFDRRTLFGLAASAPLFADLAFGQAAPSQGTSETVRLWPGKPPGWTQSITPKIYRPEAPETFAPEIIGIADPMLFVFRPAQPNGTGVLVIPGGGYRFEAYENEGMRQAAWLSARGITAFVLLYRLPAEGWLAQADVPLQDAQRALRLIRADAERYRIGRDRLAVLGFSAGGHLAGSIATRFAESVYPAQDAADRENARPDAVGMLYPVVTLDPAITHAGSRANLIGAGADAARTAHYSVDRRVTADTPPVFLVHAADDRVVQVENSLLMYRAMLAAKRPCALHLFERGGHGFGVNLPPSEPASQWPELFARFLSSHGLAA